ncbi:MAG: alpha/beta hydrolase [Pseudomonadota bacterium]
MLASTTLLASLCGTAACVHSAVYTHRIEAAHPEAGQLIDVNGHDVHVLTAGETGPPVLMIHGASANAREFSWTLAPRLQDAHRVFMADRPGHGHSERPPDGHQLGVQAAQMAGTLNALVADEPAVVVGHSFGGAVALRLALDHPGKVKALVLSAPVSHDWGGGGEAWYNAYAAPPVTGHVFSQLVPIVGPRSAQSGVLNVFDPAPAPEDYYEKSAIGLLFRPPSFRANARDVQFLRAEIAAQQDRYPSLAMPIVVFSGAGDTVIKPSLHVGRLKHEAQDLTLVALPDEGHMPHHGEGAAMADTIARLARGERPAIGKRYTGSDDDPHTEPGANADSKPHNKPLATTPGAG